jgi:tetratricopeptide (TPR) repeat protein
MKSITICFIVLLSFCLQPHAQDLKIPDASSSARIEQDFGLGHITINYSRPNVKARKIFGEVEPYGLVWRTGANAATKIKLTDTVLIEGHQLAPGEYSLFTIPSTTEWTIIFNKTAEQWGAYAYDSSKDLLRFKIKPGTLDNKLETFTIQFANVFIEHCELQLLWENTALILHLQTDVDSRVMANIDQAMKGEKKPYYRAAIYYYNHQKDMNKALAWINEAEKVQPQAYNVKYWKARIELKLGDKKAAITTANEGLKLAMAEPNAEYVRMNKEVLADAGK